MHVKFLACMQSMPAAMESRMTHCSPWAASSQGCQVLEIHACCKPPIKSQPSKTTGCATLCISTILQRQQARQGPVNRIRNSSRRKRSEGLCCCRSMIYVSTLVKVKFLSQLYEPILHGCRSRCPRATAFSAICLQNYKGSCCSEAVASS